MFLLTVFFCNVCPGCTFRCNIPVVNIEMYVRMCYCLSHWVYWTNLLEIEFIFSTHEEIATK